MLENPITALIETLRQLQFKIEDLNVSLQSKIDVAPSPPKDDDETVNFFWAEHFEYLDGREGYKLYMQGEKLFTDNPIDSAHGHPLHLLTLTDGETHFHHHVKTIVDALNQYHQSNAIMKATLDFNNEMGK